MGAFDIICFVECIKRALGAIKLVEDVKEALGVLEVLSEVGDLWLSSLDEVPVHPSL